MYSCRRQRPRGSGDGDMIATVDQRSTSSPASAAAREPRDLSVDNLQEVDEEEDEEAADEPDGSNDIDQLFQKHRQKDQQSAKTSSSSSKGQQQHFALMTGASDVITSSPQVNGYLFYTCDNHSQFCSSLVCSEI